MMAAAPELATRLADEIVLEALLQRVGRPAHLAGLVHRAIDAATRPAPVPKRPWPAAVLVVAAAIVVLMVGWLAGERPRLRFTEARAAHAFLAASLQRPVDREYRVSDPMGLDVRLTTRGVDRAVIEIRGRGPFGEMRFGVDGNEAWFMPSGSSVQVGSRREFENNPVHRLVTFVDATLKRMLAASDLVVDDRDPAATTFVLRSAELRTRIVANGASGELVELEAPWFMGNLRVEFLGQRTLPSSYYAHEFHHGDGVTVTAPPRFPFFMDWMRRR